MICKFCGNVIEDNSDFCFICGQKVVAEAPAYAAEVYSQKPEGAPAEVAPEQLVYAVPAEPVYAPPVVPEAEETTKKGKKKAKKAKKAKKEKKADKAELTKGGKFFTGLFAALFLAVAGIMILMNNVTVALACAVVAVVVGFIYYKNYKKALAAGYEAKAVEILNIGMIGLCVGMAVVVLALIKNYIF